MGIRERTRPDTSKKPGYITAEGYRLLQEEADFLWNRKRPEVTAALTAAAAEGDRSEIPSRLRENHPAGRETGGEENCHILWLPGRFSWLKAPKLGDLFLASRSVGKNSGLSVE